MTSYAKACLILTSIAVTGAMWQAVSDCGADNRFSSLQRLATGEIERIKAARERASEILDLSDDGSYERLQRSEEDLIRRIETLDRILEQIKEQVRALDSVSRPVSPIAAEELCVSVSEIDLQLRATRALAKRLEAVRRTAESKAAETTGFARADSWNKPCGCGDLSDDKDASNCVGRSSTSTDPFTWRPKGGGG